MKLSEIHKKAKALGMKDAWKFSKKQLIKRIQRSEGNIDCFDSGRKECDQYVCCFRPDCIK